MKSFRLTPPKPPLPTEYDEQSALIEWADLAACKHPELRWLHASQNGAHMHIATAIKQRKSGMRKGIPDLSLPAPRGSYHGLYIEMKRIKGGRIDPEQDACHRFLRA